MYDASDTHASTAAWRILTLAVDTYRFINISGEPADEISAAAVPDADVEDDPGDTDVDGPLDHVLGASTSPYYFDRCMIPGEYTLHWQPMASPGLRYRTVPFTLPPSGVDSGTLLHRVAVAVDDDEAVG
jgi:hypothetical protein